MEQQDDQRLQTAVRREVSLVEVVRRVPYMREVSRDILRLMSFLRLRATMPFQEKGILLSLAEMKVMVEMRVMVDLVWQQVVRVVREQLLLRVREEMVEVHMLAAS
jgi:hypothetical protein